MLVEVITGHVSGIGRKGTVKNISGRSARLLQRMGKVRFYQRKDMVAEPAPVEIVQVQRTAAEAVAIVKEADALTLAELAEGEERKTVLAAIEKRRREFGL